MFDVDGLLDFLDEVIKQCEAVKNEENKQENKIVKKEECSKKECKCNEKKTTEDCSCNRNVYDKLTDKVLVNRDNEFIFINNDDSTTKIVFGTEGASITDNQLLVALLYRYRNDVRKYNYVKELLV